MAAQAVAKVVVTGEGAVAAPHANRSTLTLPAGATRPQRPSTAAVVVFDQASPERPKPYCTSDTAAEDARQQREQAQARERQSRAQAEAILRQRRAGGTEEDGEAMLIRPHRMIPIAFLSSDTLEAALCRQFADSHLIDRLWDRSQLNDWQYAVANRLLQLCDEAGLLSSQVAPVGQIGRSHGEISEAMARARRLWNRLMREIGYPGDELLTSLCHEQLTLRGQASRAEALQEALRHLARFWGMPME